MGTLFYKDLSSTVINVDYYVSIVNQILISNFLTLGSRSLRVREKSHIIEKEVKVHSPMRIMMQTICGKGYCEQDRILLWIHLL